MAAPRASGTVSVDAEAQMYDAIIVGARCAGSPTAMLLAQQGFKVLLVDRATFPSDTISTHLVHPPGVSALKRWGLLDRVIATGCPPIPQYVFDFGPFTIAGTPGLPEQPASYGPRRTVLDKILVDAASEAGAEVREGFTVEEILLDDGDLAFRKKVHELLDRGDLDILVDLAGVTYIDSSGVGMIVAKLKTVTDKGGRMKLLHLTRRSQRLLALMKLSLVFETFDDEALGVRSFSWNAGR